MVDTLVPEPGRLHRDPQAGHGLLLADVLVEGSRSELALELRFLGRGRPAQDLPSVCHRRVHARVPVGASAGAPR